MSTILLILSALLVGYVLYISLPEQVHRYQQNDQSHSAGRTQETIPDLLAEHPFRQNQSVKQTTSNIRQSAVVPAAKSEIVFLSSSQWSNLP